MPLFNGGGSGGIILRPGSTPIACGKGGDSGGSCGGMQCPPLKENEVLDWASAIFWPNPFDGCGGEWGLRDFGRYLKRQAWWQRKACRLEHNEIIVEGKSWNDALPGLVDAFVRRACHTAYYTPVRAREHDQRQHSARPRLRPRRAALCAPGDALLHPSQYVTVRGEAQAPGRMDEVREAFLKAFPQVDGATVPLVAFDTGDWSTPFTLVAPQPETGPRAERADTATAEAPNGDA